MTEEIRKRVEASYQFIISLVKQNRDLAEGEALRDRYVWQTFQDPEALGKARLLEFRLNSQQKTAKSILWTIRYKLKQ